MSSKKVQTNLKLGQSVTAKAPSKAVAAKVSKSFKEGEIDIKKSPRLNKSPSMKSSLRGKLISTAYLGVKNIQLRQHLSCVFGCLVLSEPIHDQIERRFQIDVCDEPQMPNTADAKVGKPDISEGTLDTTEPEPTVSAGPVLESESGVDLANIGAKSTQDVVARARVPASLKDLVDKYCVATCEIPLERIVPGNNPRLVRSSGVKVIQDAIQNSGWDESSTFIVQLVTDDERFSKPEDVRKDEVLLKFAMEEGMHALVNGHHREKAVHNLQAVHFNLFPLPKKFLCKICVGITKWEHFLISKKANFVSSAAVEDTMYDKVFALDFSLQQFEILFPSEIPTEKKIKAFYDNEVGAKAMSAGSFNLYFNLSKCLTQDAKDLLKARTSDADHEFCTTDAMKTVIHVTKNIFKNKPTLANQYQIYSIDCMYRYYISSGEKKLSSVTFNTLSSYIAMHVDFQQSCLYKLAEELEIAVDQVVIPPPVHAWFQEHLVNFDTSAASIECCVQFVQDNVGLLAANPAHIPFELRTILSRAISILKPAPKKSKKRQVLVSDEEEEGYGSTSGTPVKHILTKKGGKPARKQQKALEVEQINDSDNAIDPDATEEEMEFEVNEVMQVDHLAAQVLYDPATRYRCASKEVLDRAKAFWIGSHNCQVNTPETDAVVKAKSEWVQVLGEPLNLKETDGLKPGAFVCLDVREFENYHGASFQTVLKFIPSLLLRGGCLIIVGNIQQVRTVNF